MSKRARVESDDVHEVDVSVERSEKAVKVVDDEMAQPGEDEKKEAENVLEVTPLKRLELDISFLDERVGAKSEVILFMGNEQAMDKVPELHSYDRHTVTLNIKGQARVTPFGDGGYVVYGFDQLEEVALDPTVMSAPVAAFAATIKDLAEEALIRSRGLCCMHWDDDRMGEIRLPVRKYSVVTEYAISFKAWHFRKGIYATTKWFLHEFVMPLTADVLVSRVVHNPWIDTVPVSGLEIPRVHLLSDEKAVIQILHGLDSAGVIEMFEIGTEALERARDLEGPTHNQLYSEHVWRHVKPVVPRHWAREWDIIDSSHVVFTTSDFGQARVLDTSTFDLTAKKYQWPTAGVRGSPLVLPDGRVAIWHAKDQKSTSSLLTMAREVDDAAPASAPGSDLDVGTCCFADADPYSHPSVFVTREGKTVFIFRSADTGLWQSAELSWTDKYLEATKPSTLTFGPRFSNKFELVASRNSPYILLYKRSTACTEIFVFEDLGGECVRTITTIPFDSISPPLGSVCLTARSDALVRIKLAPPK
jgi:hypothetical protein